MRRDRGGGTAALHLVLEEDLQKTATGHSQTRSVAGWMQDAQSRQASALNSGG